MKFELRQRPRRARRSFRVGAGWGILAGVWLGWFPAANPLDAACFTNAIRQGKDPAVIFKDGLFHLVQSDGCNIRLRRTSTLGGLATASNPIIFSPGCSELWAPEIHWISNRWYLYYTLNTNLTTGGIDRRGFVAESLGTVATGPYTNRGILFPDWWNIDGSVFTWNNQLYYLFSGEPVRGAQNIYIAPMSNPYTLSGPPVLISAPTQSWERVGNPDVNEGPWGFQREGRLFVVYSASGCWTDDYTLGLLTMTGTNPLAAASWTKTGPVFTQKPGAYGPGHNSLVQDAAGQWWNAYHANTNSGQGCGEFRRIRAQRLFWKSDGTPDFGSAVPDGSVLTDSPDFLVAHYPLLETNGFAATSTVCGHAGIVAGPVVWANPGLRFDGTNTHVDCGPAYGNDVQHQLTLAAWIRADRFQDWAGIITKGTNVSPYALQLWGDGSLRFTANWGSPAGGVGSGSWNSAAKLTAGQWHHVMVTYDGERVRFYRDGVLDTNQPQVALRLGVAFEPLVLGADFPGGDEFFAGTMRSARVYGRALTASELLAVENFPPTLAPFANVQAVAGQPLEIPSVASDPNIPAQTLSFSLASGPGGAAVNSANGVFTWRPALEQSPSTNAVTVVVKDNGVPSLSATQSFTIHVRRPVTPVLSQPTLSSDSVEFDVTGDSGVDYAVLTSTNLFDWTLLYTTNPPVTPFRIAVPVSPHAPAGYYRVEHR